MEPELTPEALKLMSISKIATLVRKDWKPVNFAAKPYLEAMGGMTDLDGMFGQDSNRSIVLYFLSNATTWRGNTARLVKAELNRRLKVKR